MPVKRRKAKARQHRITPEAIAAFEAGDFLDLHRALDLAPWEPSPLPSTVEPYGVDPAAPPSPDDQRLYALAWPKIMDLQRQLVAAGAKIPTKARCAR